MNSPISRRSRTATPEAAPVRSTYRHGDLRRALLEAGLELARDGGPEAVVLREVTRRAGVVPNAAYRHFANREALLQSVRGAALSAVAGAMEDELATLRPASLSPASMARASLRAVGIGYLRFAHAQPGLLRTAFSLPIPPEEGSNKGPRSGLTPFELLGAALDRMVECGALPKAQRPDAEYLAWSAVHGLAMLVIDGPLRHLTTAQMLEMGQRLVDIVERGMAPH
jgi:AcrR family transcriptional regulator